MKISPLAIGVISTLCLSACGKSNTPEEGIAPEQSITEASGIESSILDVVQPGEAVLASVNGSRIGEDDLSVNMAHTLGDSYLQLADSQVEEKVLESMIASRAIAKESFDAMTVEERVSLEKRVARYREELLVKDYLLNNAEPNTITSEAIKNYYEENPEEFAGAEERLYEIVTVSPEIYKSDSKSALDTLQLAKTHDDWRLLTRDVADERVKLLHGYESVISTNDQTTSIEKAVSSLNAGQMSRVIIQDGAPYLVRLLEIKQGNPIPLSQARASIKRKLLPATVRESVRQVSDSVLANSEVVLAGSPESAQ